jgi:hypothetical protein
LTEGVTEFRKRILAKTSYKDFAGAALSFGRVHQRDFPLTQVEEEEEVVVVRH